MQPILNKFRSLMWLAASATFLSNSYGGCFSECCAKHRASEADAVVIALVEDLIVEVGKENNFVTTATLGVQESILGVERLETIEVSFPGGKLGDVVQYDSLHVSLKKGSEYIFHLKEEGGAWSIYQASAEEIQSTGQVAQSSIFGGGSRSGKSGGNKSESCDGLAIPQSRETVSGYFESSGIPARLRRCDSGQPLLVEVDSQILPSGMSQAEALGAVRDALDAWEAVSGLTFLITANYNFGQSARNMDGGESTIHIQLHNSYNEISSLFTLGRGGGSSSTSSGGTVNGAAFNRSLNRWVIINHQSSTNENPQNFAEVLTHELGHAFGLEHSSEDSEESEPLLREATMYFRVHKDGRGASTRCYDADRIQYGYPNALPPVAFERYLRAVSRPSSQPVSQANKLVLDAYSSSGAALSYSFPEGLNTSIGSWDWEESSRTLTFDPEGYFSDSIASGNSFFTRLNYEVSDGVNQGAGSIKVIALRQDDGGSEPEIGVNNSLPEAWLESVFGAAEIRNDPTNPLFQPSGDFDGDGLTNLEEFQMGTDAADAVSGPVKLTSADDYSWLEIENAPLRSLMRFETGNDLDNWNVLSLLEATAQTSRIYLVPPEGDRNFFRVIYQH